MNQLRSLPSVRRFEPSISSEERNDLYAKWLHCIALNKLDFSIALTTRVSK
ncbi:hypothetical protein PUND_a0223 [Pseudoalteromonas undina]|nr:hypothetical protein PUND_a0223 [Pseudoalteromonas undina]